MIKAVICPALSAALDKLKEIISDNELNGKNTVIFCEDRLTLAAERTVCNAVGGSFSVGVYTFARFLSSERGKREGVLSSQGSAMVIRAIIEKNRDRLKLFGRFAAASSAGAVYDTIALLYASKISPEDVMRASASGLLESKLHDIGVIYSEYVKYLKENGRTDRNAYLGELPEVIEKSARIAGSQVIFLGFQSFTRSSLECVRAAFGRAQSVYGLFIGGKEELYVNESSSAFTAAAEEFGGAVCERVASGLIPQAELLRKSLFDPESFYSGNKMNCGNVHIYEAADEDEELEFIAANIKKHVIDGGERYAKISVMLPDAASAERDVKRVFSQYRIPYYADIRHKLSDHPVCAFIVNYLICASSGCPFRETDGIISSVFFPADGVDKDIFRNYLLRLANFRGGIKRQPKKEITDSFGFNTDTITCVRDKFLRGLEFIPAKGGISDICVGVRRLMEDFCVKEKLESLAETYRDEYPAEAEFSKRVYEAVLSVLSEAEDISDAGYMPLKEFIKVLKSGFDATEISLIPPKADAVFVGDLASTANTGSNVVFAVRLTGDVPASSADTALLTDREISALENADLGISPKIRQVNMRRRETTALNICAFRKYLYLTYPVRSGGEECSSSEIISYAQAVFATAQGGALMPAEVRRFKNSEKTSVYYCTEKLPAMKMLFSRSAGEVLSVLEENGYKSEAREILGEKSVGSINNGRGLFVAYDSISPTALETYFTCPYRNFIQQGLRLQEREEGQLRPVDTGNFIHTVLQNIAPELNTLNSAEDVRARAHALADELLASPVYSSLQDSESGRYTAERLKEEAGEVSAGAYAQIAASLFKVEATETKCSVALDGGIKINGRIDRVDSFGDMVRVIDYKTGTVDGSPTKYYMGLKLQLPLYLLSASSGRRAVGAYYFPASTEYKSKADGVFRLQGFMDGGDEAVSASDTTVKPKEKSQFFDAYLSGKKIDSAMSTEDFGDFIAYSSLVARKGAKEMLDGNITPSPAADACKYCKAGGSCGFEEGVDGQERDCRTVRCSEIAEIVKRQRSGQ